ncbi:alpha/beta hydrolase [Sphingomonas sp. RRHST34]|uniref:Alpha/beta hydrolase n=2 Tax=Sphingomonas citri TaxID=2862499 RepID=A0ABS7BN37_9SPHN|nr:alpha/beta hydrolase [Sphingomonas citri]
MRRGWCAAAAAALAWGVGAAAQSPAALNDAPPPPPTAAGPAPAVADDMRGVLEQLPLLGARPIATLTPVEARLEPTAADAYNAAIRKSGMSVAPDATVTTQDLAYGTDPMQYARLYRPGAAAGTGAPLPLLVYYHGGGWVLADLTAYDATPRLLAKQLNAIVVSVEYRRAPEFRFPAQHDDAAAAYGWAVQHAAAWGADPARVALAGEGAGGNLALNTAISARDHALARPAHVLAIYPIANSDPALPSRRDSAGATPLDTAMLGWFAHYHGANAGDAADPRLNLVKADLRGLPPVTIVNAQIDPLRSDGETLAQALRGAGVSVQQRTYNGVTHEFFGMGRLVRGAYDAELYAVARLKSAFGL